MLPQPDTPRRHTSTAARRPAPAFTMFAPSEGGCLASAVKRTHLAAGRREMRVEPPPQKHPELPPRKPGSSNGDVTRLSTTELMARIAQDAQGLVKAEISLAKTELRADLRGVL